jgi:hypothetical protein
MCTHTYTNSHLFARSCSVPPHFIPECAHVKKLGCVRACMCLSVPVSMSVSVPVPVSVMTES